MPLVLRSILMLLGSLLLIAAAPAPTTGQERVPAVPEREKPERPQVAAATAEAVANLRDTIERASINRRVTVAEFLRRTAAEDELTKGLQRAELVGGPRWVDNDTCQVQLEISGPRVASILQTIAIAHKDDSPVPPEEVVRLGEDWRRRTFSGFGTSTAFGRVAKARPVGADGTWRSVPDADRQKALAAAKADAIGRVLDSIKPLPLTPDKTVADALANPDVRKDLNDWLENRPVTRVEYRRDMQVELYMAGTAGGCFDVLRRSVSDHTDWKLPRTEAGWAANREQFERHMASPIGRGSAPAPVPTSAMADARPVPRAVLPTAPPDWVDRKLEAEGVADGGGFKLKAAREAETIARRKLADAINDLPLAGGVTVGKAAEKDPRVHDAISAALDKAKSRTDYNHAGGVAVNLKLDLQDLWDSLRAER
jgi:hypothetical protein